jgi:carbamoyltransferase
MIILGLGGLQGDASAAVLKDGKIVAAIEEAKLARASGAPTRPELPEAAMAACLDMAGAKPQDVDCVAMVRPFSAPVHLELRAMFPASRIVLVEHHTAHAASAFYPSPFDEATVLVLDRGGDFRSGTRWHGAGSRLTLEREIYFPDSLGDLYGRTTELLGFNANSEEHKVQWLSVAGNDRYRDLFLDAIPAHTSGWPHADRSYFDADRITHGGFSRKFLDCLGVSDPPGAIPEPQRAEIAAGVQRAVEQRAIEMAGAGSNLCFAGGLGLNALLVAALERSAAFENVFVQPAAGNAGTALGAVLYAWHHTYERTGRVPLESVFLGPGYNAEQIKQVLENCKLRFRYHLTTGEVIETAIARLNDHKILAWMHGRMEFGPRALGNRSILASPLNPYSTENLNIYIKHREPYRKFAASVPAEVAGEYFECGPNARYLATVGRVRPAHRATFEAAVLARDLVRVHVVHPEDNPLYHRLLLAAGKSTGLPVLYNTSFNLFGEPLVCSPRDAVRSFFSSGIDAMFVGNFLLEK